MVRLTDRPDMTLDVYHGGKTTTQQQLQILLKVTVLKIALKDLIPGKVVILDWWFGSSANTKL